MPDFDVKSVVTTPQGGAKSGISFPGSKAFAGMTVGDVSRVVGSFVGGDVSCP